MSNKTTEKLCEDIKCLVFELKDWIKIISLSSPANKTKFILLDNLINTLTNFTQAFNEEKLQEREKELHLKGEIERLRTKLKLKEIEGLQANEVLNKYKTRLNTINKERLLYIKNSILKFAKGKESTRKLDALISRINAFIINEHNTDNKEILNTVYKDDLTRINAKLYKCKSKINLNKRDNLFIRKGSLINFFKSNLQVNSKPKIEFSISKDEHNCYEGDSEARSSIKYNKGDNRSLLKSYLYKDKKSYSLQKSEDNYSSNAMSEVDNKTEQPIIMSRSYGNQHSEVNVNINILDEKMHKQLLKSQLSMSKLRIRQDKKKQEKRSNSLKLIEHKHRIITSTKKKPRCNKKTTTFYSHKYI